MTFLDAIESTNDDNAFICLLCVRNCATRDEAIFQSSSSASNMYSYFKSAHNDINAILQPIIKSREKNKKRKLEVTSCINNMLSRERQKALESQLLNFMAHSDIPKHAVETLRFLSLFKSCNPSVTIPTSKTMN